MKLVQRIAAKNPCYLAGKKIVPKGVMIHSIGVPQPNPVVIADNFNARDADSCVHAVVGAGETVYQLLPWDRRAWHCGSGPNGSGNNTHISFEMTEPSTIRYSSGSAWTDLDPSATRAHVLGTYRNAVALTARLCREYGLDPLSDGVLLSHAEGHARGIASNHGDVEHIWDREKLSMEQFRRDVAAAMREEPDGAKGMDSAKKPDDAGETDGKAGAGTSYIVQAGAFEDRRNAEALAERMKEAGFPAFVREI